MGAYTRVRKWHIPPNYFKLLGTSWNYLFSDKLTHLVNLITSFGKDHIKNDMSLDDEIILGCDRKIRKMP